MSSDYWGDIREQGRNSFSQPDSHVRSYLRSQPDSTAWDRLARCHWEQDWTEGQQQLLREDLRDTAQSLFKSSLQQWHISYFSEKPIPVSHHIYHKYFYLKSIFFSQLKTSASCYLNSLLLLSYKPPLSIERPQEDVLEPFSSPGWTTPMTGHGTWCWL